jgi:hypothetical protein
MNRNVLLSTYWIPFNAAKEQERFDRFTRASRGKFIGLIESILIHDQVVVPCADFLPLAAIVQSLGVSSVRTLLETGALRFVRIKGVFAILGKDGLQSFVIYRDNEAVPPGGHLEDAIPRTLGCFPPGNEAESLTDLVTGATIEVEAASYLSDVRCETESDFHQLLLDGYHVVEGAGPIRDDIRLPHNQVKLYGGDKLSARDDDPATFLSLAYWNLEMKLAEEQGCADSATASPVADLLWSKIRRTENIHENHQKIDLLMRILGVPDPGSAALADPSVISEFVKLRGSDDAKAFRRWFHENCENDPVSVAREYGALMRQIPVVSQLPAKTLRFISTAILSPIPVLGTAASAIDCFLIERLLRGSSPRFFIDKLRSIALKQG